jgi:putative transposase
MDGETRTEPKSFPSRHHPAHGVHSDSHNPIIVFLTVCTKDRSPWLANAAVHSLLREAWSTADAWLIGRYVIMPDHLHLFAAPNPVWEGEAPAEPQSFDSWVRYWKSQFTKRHRKVEHQWQTDHWDRRLRREESYADKWEYVRNNPVRHGFVSDRAQWLYQGQLHDLKW